MLTLGLQVLKHTWLLWHLTCLVLNFWTAFMIMGLDRTYHTHQFTLHFSLHLQSILVCIFCSFCVVD